MTQIANYISLSRFANPIEIDQAGWDACVPSAFVRILQAQSKESGITNAPEWSTQFTFNDSQYIQSQIGGGGLTINTVKNSMMYHGVCLDADYGWLNGRQGEIPPSSQAYGQAAPHKVSGFTTIGISTNQMDNVMKVATELQHGHFVAIQTINVQFVGGASIFDSHEMVVDTVDYQTQTVGGFNSYGPNWNGDGRFKISFANFSNHGGVMGATTIDGFNGLDWKITPTESMVSELGVDILGRFFEHGGNAWYADLIDNNGLTITNAANGIAESSEGKAIFGNLTHGQQAAKLFVNTVGWAATQSDINYYGGKLDAGLSIGDITAMLANAVKTGAAGINSQDRMANLTTAADYNAGALNATSGVKIELTGISHDANTLASWEMSR